MLIGSRKIKEKIINQLIRNIKKKKELSYLADSFIKDSLKSYLKQNAKTVNFLVGKFNEKAGEYKKIMKDLRKELRRVHGLYEIQQNAVKRKEAFNELIKTKPKEKKFLELHKKILETHSSTRERLKFYNKLYPDLFKITGKPQTIIDLGCGINPFSIPLMKLDKLNFYAYDINEDEINLIKDYFNFLSKVWQGFSGKVKVLNVMQWEKVKKLKKIDVCFLWKMTDVLDRQKGHLVSERVIINVPADFVVVSFPTFTVKGKPMNRPRRKWIELMCNRLSYKYKIVKETNEIFYILTKK